MNATGLRAVAASAVALLVVAIPNAQADRDFGDRHLQSHHWRGDIRRFDEHDFAHWRGGHWYHGLRGGRLGWWWIVGGVWYFYPQPVYPFPDPYVPPVAVAPQEIAPAPTPIPAPSSWYYCNAPKGYYPYVAECPSGWQVVPAHP